jgi:hypothetical protein
MGTAAMSAIHDDPAGCITEYETPHGYAWHYPIRKGEPSSQRLLDACERAGTSELEAPCPPLSPHSYGNARRDPSVRALRVVSAWRQFRGSKTRSVERPDPQALGRMNYPNTTPAGGRANFGEKPERESG